MQKHELLKTHFGYDSFRPGQEPVVDAILAGRDVLGVMPTGAGKSICYQLPAAMLPGMTVVVSPLISLMKDQCDALAETGIPAACLNSSLSPAEYRGVLEAAGEGRIRILYVAPERLPTQDFQSLCARVAISMIAVDEAHCISQWGQDFRPAYLRIPDAIAMLPTRPVVAAFTATATARVRTDIAEMLGLRDPFSITTGFDRANLHFAVRRPKDKWTELKTLIRSYRGRSGIVYCATRKSVEEICARLVKSGVEATRYHAGLPEEERKRSQDDFVMDRARVMVATNAFGMGIDKSNVSFVIHYNMPKNLESYYQEAGRAGRDGEPAECVLLYGAQDVVTNKFFIDRQQPNEELDEVEAELVRERALELLRQMTFYCHSDECLRRYILRYFGENAPNHCGNCSSCQGSFTEKDITVAAQKVMSCIRRTGERFGAKLVVDVLRGAANPRIEKLRLNEVSTYGIMKGEAESDIREIVEYLVLHGYVAKTDEEYPVLKLSEAAGEVLFRGRTLTMMVRTDPPAPKTPKAKKPDRTRKGAGRVAGGDDGDVPHAASNGTEGGFDSDDESLFDRLRMLRMKIAKSQQVPPYVVFSDATLRDMCRKRPRNAEEMLEVSGVGESKLKKYGTAFLNVLNEG